MMKVTLLNTNINLLLIFFFVLFDKLMVDPFFYKFIITVTQSMGKLSTFFTISHR